MAGRQCDECRQTFNSEQALGQHQRDTGHSHRTHRSWRERLRQPTVLSAAGAAAVILILGGLGYAFLGGGMAGPASDQAHWGQKADVTSEDVGTSVGKRAPEFSLSSINGEPISGNPDKPTVLFFMAAWCGSCIPEERALAKLHRQYGDQVGIISVDADPNTDSPGDVRRFQQQYGGPWPHALSGKMTQRFRVRSLDTTLVLNRNNVITYRDAHPTNRATLEREIHKVLPKDGI